jgi:hypothetical protein
VRENNFADSRNAAQTRAIKLQAGSGTNENRGVMNLPEQTNQASLPSGKDQTSQPEDTAEEARKIRRLQLMMSMVMSVIGQDPTLTLEEASELAAGAKRAALAMFPDKELAFDLIYKPRLKRLIRDRFRLQ